MKSRQSAREKGTIMIVAVSLLTVFSMMAAALGFRGGMETRLVKLQLDQFRERYMALGAVNAVQYLAETDEDGLVDGPFDAWYGEPEWPGEIDFGSLAFVHVTDEESKVNINFSSEELLRALIERVDEEAGLETETDDLTASVLYWRGGSSAQGGSQIGFEHKQAPFESLEELYLIKDITPEDVEKIRPYLTVYGTGMVNRIQLNPNTAPPLVLEALVESLIGDSLAKRDVLGQLLALRTALDEGGGQYAVGDITYFNQQDLAPLNLLLKLGLSSDVATVTLINQLSLYLTTDSRYFNIQVDIKENETSLGTRIEAVAGPSVGGFMQAAGRVPARRRFVAAPADGGGPEILSWRERS